MSSYAITRDGIAQAVMREILRDDGIEGHAYKGALDRQGSAAEKHIAAARIDSLTMANAVITSLHHQAVKREAVAQFQPHENVWQRERPVCHSCEGSGKQYKPGDSTVWRVCLVCAGTGRY